MQEARTPSPSRHGTDGISGPTETENGGPEGWIAGEPESGSILHTYRDCSEIVESERVRSVNEDEVDRYNIQECVRCINRRMEVIELD